MPFLVSPYLPVHELEVADGFGWYVEFQQILVSLHKFVEGRDRYPIPLPSVVGGGTWDPTLLLLPE
jgi:hypothetical protein